MILPCDFRIYETQFAQRNPTPIEILSKKSQALVDVPEVHLIDAANKYVGVYGDFMGCTIASRDIVRIFSSPPSRSARKRRLTHAQ